MFNVEHGMYNIFNIHIYMVSISKFYKKLFPDNKFEIKCLFNSIGSYMHVL